MFWKETKIATIRVDGEMDLTCSLSSLLVFVLMDPVVKIFCCRIASVPYHIFAPVVTTGIYLYISVLVAYFHRIVTSTGTMERLSSRKAT